MFFLYDLVADYEQQCGLNRIYLWEVLKHSTGQQVQLLRISVLGILTGFVIHKVRSVGFFVNDQQVCYTAPPHIFSEEIARGKLTVTLGNTQLNFAVLLTFNFAKRVHNRLEESKPRRNRSAFLDEIFRRFMKLLAIDRRSRIRIFEVFLYPQMVILLRA